eukprot:scaffold194745_cov18-Tisochrysis_lutea.AAC.1
MELEVQVLAMHHIILGAWLLEKRPRNACAGEFWHKVCKLTFNCQLRLARQLLHDPLQVVALTILPESHSPSRFMASNPCSLLAASHPMQCIRDACLHGCFAHSGQPMLPLLFGLM